MCVPIFPAGMSECVMSACDTNYANHHQTGGICPKKNPEQGPDLIHISRISQFRPLRQ